MSFDLRIFTDEKNQIDWRKNFIPFVNIRLLNIASWESTHPSMNSVAHSCVTELFNNVGKQIYILQMDWKLIDLIANVDGKSNQAARRKLLK